MEGTKSDTEVDAPVRKSRRRSTCSNIDTKGHISFSRSSKSPVSDLNTPATSISSYTSKRTSKDNNQSILSVNRSLGLLNGVSTEVSPPSVPYGSTLRRLEKRKKVKELTEDDYVACMENIIERDYFPDLLKYRYLKAISDAESSGNKRLAEKLSSELESIKSGQLDNNVYLKTLDDENILVDLGKDGLKLDEFNRIFSSEDNRSFDRLMQKDIEGKIAKTKWMEDVEHRHNLALSDIQKKTNLGLRSNSIQCNKFEARNSLYFNPDSTIPDRKSVEIRSKNTNLGLDQKDLDEMANMQVKRAKELKQREADEKLSHLIASQGASKNKELIEQSGQSTSYVFTPKIVAGESEPIFTWGTISSIESIPPTPMTGSDTAKKLLKSDRSLREGREFNMPKPLEREEIANKLYKKLKTPSTPLNPSTPFTPKTPLIVQKLIAKHSKGVDTQLRDSYSVKKYKSSKASSVSSKF